MHVWRQRAEALHWSVTESLTAIAEPAGLTTATTFDALKNEILDDLRNSAKPDVMLLQLHGAMVAEDEPDCEGHSYRKSEPSAPMQLSVSLLTFTATFDRVYWNMRTY